MRKTGAGFMGYYKGREKRRLRKRIGLGARAEAYDAELTALTYAGGKAQAFTKKNPAIKHWHFFADNSAAVENITDISPKPGQSYCTKFTKYIMDFLDADPEHTVEITWVPSHVGIEGNNRADTLAKEAIVKKSREPWVGSASNTA